ncbi:hypothetical protein SEA_BARB_75 [Gordonia phage Barb]|uniref:Uncharacterized protein n=5 Tax=Wizardvirus TaxID=2169658 RepID=A0A160DCM1_9CAUD|nr:hypothetical protein BH794_gp70 [Gordonia phage Wizard]YP_010096773.1 hypothetical protein KNT96_gp73 [Gordonia phage KimmyK]YP_010102228.1 hypothetical protein KNU55_gp75 [Gordonia phage Barb]YP_010102419.1 hypothetical protein KNU57_gp74 [Gordonia phage Valary]QXO14454.1 hypothetical protein SEA_FUGAX_76 [Gordonia phage Fugax]WNM73189.1 hypothetical protein SEA_CLAMCHOWDER_75 [Gordonia phage ClamChowder]WNO27939.1 hypothetical protein SEA_HALO3_71 [Gordonia phage Halo3]ANA85375.1 hypoth
MSDPRPMKVPLAWTQTKTYVRKVDGRWWVAYAPFVDTTYAMGQVAGIVDQRWWVWWRFDHHADALEFAVGLQRSAP